ncbi:MAG: cytochrome c maturation protein CcmE [Pelagibacterales bacterium]|nr:cytochrome c maturation protein CcmE [Pelagibacterales bacterium]
MKNNRKKKRLIFIAITFVISVIALVFVIMNFRDSIVFFYSPSELQSSETLKKVQGKQIRIGGLVVEGSIKRIDALNVEFVVTDLEKEIKVNYKGVLPDLFRDEQGVVAKGKFDEQVNEFFSSELLVKHDEKYMPPEVAKSLKEKHNK